MRYEDKPKLGYSITEIDMRDQTVYRSLRGDYPDEVDCTVMVEYDHTRSSHAEQAASQFYESQGYEVENLESNSNIRRHVPKEIADSIAQRIKIGHRRDYLSDNASIESVFEELDDPIKLIEDVGIPDLFVYDSELVEEWFFSEVKSEDDKLSRAQLTWIMEFDFLPTRVAYVDEDGPSEILYNL